MLHEFQRPVYVGNDDHEGEWEGCDVSGNVYLRFVTIDGRRYDGAGFAIRHPVWYTAAMRDAQEWWQIDGWQEALDAEDAAWADYQNDGRE
jgi:hypothetical protein